MANATFPNPDTYLNHLPPTAADQFEVARNVYLVVLGAAIWDILIYIPQDLKILCGGIFSLIVWCFVLSRVFAVTYIILFVVMQTRPIASCDAMQIVIEVFCSLSMACTSFLFLRRLEAVYAGKRVVQWIFRFLWLVTSADTVTVVIGIGAEHIEGTGYCIVYKVKDYAAVNQFFPAVFDTLVFFAITYKIALSRSTIDSKLSWNTLVTRKALPRLSRALLHGGQQYYLIVFSTSVVSGVFLFATSIPPIYRPMLTPASTALTASMACRVFRNLKTLDHDHVPTTKSVPSDLNFAIGGISSKSIPPTGTKPSNLRTSIIPVGNADQSVIDSELGPVHTDAPRHSWTSSV